MRANRRRSHHSVSSLAGSVNFPRRMTPLVSRRNSSFSTSDAEIPSTAASRVAETGPACAIQPVTMASCASSWEVSVEGSSGSEMSKIADGKI